MANKIKTKTLAENDCGVVLQLDKIPSNMFEFFLHKKRTFKDGTSQWNIGVSPSANTDKGFVFESIRGTKEDAMKTFNAIVNSYNS